ncbi:MAG: ATP-dependent Clp protease ATP-binding subunit ClpC, partial [Candidatus Saganbacteria bacterium]
MASQDESKRLSSSSVGCEHLILGMIKEKDQTIEKVLGHFNITPPELKTTIEQETTSIKDISPSGEIPFSPAVKKVIEYAWEEARGLGHSYIGVEHIFLAVLREGSGICGKIFSTLGISAPLAKSKLISMFAEETEKKAAPRTSTPVLDQFSRDLTRMSREKKLDPVIGRGKEIERVIQILSRRKKNNPVLIGEAGVGKTAIVEGLAQRIISGNVPPVLLDQRVVSLDLGLMIAGTRYRGEFEERMKKALEEIRRAKKVIVFIDELHTLIGAGSAEGAMDAANILKPALARGEMQCIGATTLDEYRKKIESDPALERRFQPIFVSEPTAAETIEILKGLKNRYEDFHKVRISEDALVSAVRLSQRYISDRRLPDKAIDLIDEASSKIMLKSQSAPPELLEIIKQMEKIKTEKETAVSNQEYETAAQLRDLEDELRQKYEEASNKMKVSYENMPLVDSETIAEVVSLWTNVPVTQLTTEETERLLKMEDSIKSRIIGQDDAVKEISKSIRRARAGLKDPRRPIGSFIFLGPSGVGKTELA